MQQAFENAIQLYAKESLNEHRLLQAEATIARLREELEKEEKRLAGILS